MQDSISGLQKEEEASAKNIAKLKQNIARFEAQIAELNENPEEEAGPLITRKVCSACFYRVTRLISRR